jgi:hypothetical protein
VGIEAFINLALGIPKLQSWDMTNQDFLWILHCSKLGRRPCAGPRELLADGERSIALTLALQVSV